MAAVIEFTVEGEPASKERPRVYKGHAITPQRTQAAERKVLDTYLAKYPNNPPVGEYIRVELWFWMKSHRIKDIDNLTKLVFDALNGIAFEDDRQIVMVKALKIMPDLMVQDKEKGAMRKRRKGDPLTYKGVQYEPHTNVVISLAEKEE